MRRVVVTGIGCVTPVGNDVETTWNNLVNGVCGIGKITAFDTGDCKAKVAGEVKDFDPLKYIEKRDVRKTDRYVQLAIAAAQQAVDDSGIMGNIDENRFGVYVGSGVGGMQTFYDNSVAFYTGGSRKVSPHFIPMMISNIAAGQVAIRFKAKGVCIPIVTACSTGTHELGEAYLAIKNGLADAIIAGGSEAAITPLTVAGFANCKALTLVDDPEKASIP